MVILKRSCKDCKERPTQLEKFDELVEAAKTYSVVLIVGVIVIGILLIFACSLFRKEIPGLEEMNLFVSIVIGIVATIVSIVSMLISFYGLEKPKNLSGDNMKCFSKFSKLKKIHVDPLKQSKTPYKQGYRIRMLLCAI